MQTDYAPLRELFESFEPLWSALSTRSDDELRTIAQTARDLAVWCDTLTRERITIRTWPATQPAGDTTR